MTQIATEAQVEEKSSPWSVFLIFLRLGLTSFGGPIAHLGFFRTEFVDRRRWVDETHYADVVALSQFLPGPASSKVGIILGVIRAGIPGALAAFQVQAENPITGDRTQTNTAYLVYVALDDKGQPVSGCRSTASSKRGLLSRSACPTPRSI